MACTYLPTYLPSYSRTLLTRYVWLAGFYAFFHVWLNVLAELLRFGDRVFYLEWWVT